MLTNWMDSLVNEEEGDITRISLSNLTVNATSNLVADVLRMDIYDDKALIEELASSYMRKKTLGNPFFVMEFLRSLQRSEILSFDIMKLSWSWDTTQLQEETEATDNVIDYMKRQMASLPKDLSDFLPYAACLGSTFSSRQLDTVFTACQAEGIGWNVPTSKWLEYCVSLGFISSLENDSSYRWVHDKVQEAAFSLLPPDEVERVQFHVGEILLENLSPVQTRENVLAVANLFIKGLTKRSEMNEQKCLKVAKICLEAGHTLMISAAFSEAVTYLDAGIMFLPANHWKIDRVLSLELYSSAAESESLAGDGRRIEQYCYEVINQKDASMTEKFRAYDVLITFTWGKKNDYQGAADMALHVLTELGCKLPKRMQLFHVLSGIIKMKRTMKNFGPDAILSHEEMTEYPKVQSMVMLDRLVTVAYQLKSPYLPLAILKSFNWSIKYGVSEYSPSAFALVALVLMAQLKDFELSRTWANYALNLIRTRKEYEVARSRTLFVTHGFVLHASLPYQKCAQRLLEGYRSGMSTGDTENACWNAYVYCDISFYTGKNLRRLSADWEVYTNQMFSLQKMQPCNQSKHLWQVAQNLMGLSDDPFVLKGKAYSFDETEFETMGISTVVSVYNSLVYLAYFMCDDINGADWALELYTKYTEEEMDPGTFINDSLRAHIAVLCYSAARKSKKKQYVSLARKCHKHVRTIGKKGNPNLTHMEKLLDAEFDALKGRKSEARRNYEAAITLAARKGIVSEQAIINERYGDFVFESLIDYNDTSYRYRHAVELYEEWGAAAKVQKLQKKLENLTVQR
eukprot:CAMPEP_0178748948 /NCGR_PEP_ID=MMETSP0744-20121128/9148_1 /TAXON_ID=913974 /ORGANISM="Nitzschia punctata, Strain CCMP561" /LENGTH=799 /DNA_ID=CAMNT_0020402327 /DNA_START=49 /DNA_END=2449 /DNA_ORIENTATION=+